MGRLSDILKRYDLNDLNDLAVSDDINPHDQTTIIFTTKPPTLTPAELRRNDDVSANDQRIQNKPCAEAVRAELGRNVVKVVSPLALEPDPLSDTRWSGYWRERIQTRIQALEDWVWREEYDLMRTANNGLPSARAQAREKLTRWYLFMLGDHKE